MLISIDGTIEGNKYDKFNRHYIKTYYGLRVKISSETEIQDCIVSYVQKIISGKWNIIIIYFLSCGTMRFGELQRKLPTIAGAVLTKKLRLLEEFDLVHREVYKQVPPKVEYSLTEKGIQFLPIISALAEWGEVKFVSRKPLPDEHNDWKVAFLDVKEDIALVLNKHLTLC